ncbi:hypothetical protein [Actinomadura rubrisoli]|uniref:Secreted protein n=1 Tax=Actinomadura rubrisoli TaxID=2530368 RepID=A0A4R5B2G7_9ACTN|nr:hypothetical protein [Actinomadura rubrisoli]TDD79911.1 hypothetical protein E1298_26830 [Actinomadura rubrisoli]
MSRSPRVPRLAAAALLAAVVGGGTVMTTAVTAATPATADASECQKYLIDRYPGVVTEAAATAACTVPANLPDKGIPVCEQGGKALDITKEDASRACSLATQK